MATLTLPDDHVVLTEPADIRDFLGIRGILWESWPAPCVFRPDASQDEILDAYAPVLRPYMERNGYQTADVISVHSETPNIAALKAKFLPEHTHTEDEVRFFVEGHGDFWFNLPRPLSLENAERSPEAEGGLARQAFCVRCVSGDLLSVPASFPHWFDMGPIPFVKTIRIFTDASGWTPHYTGSGIETHYCAVPQA